MIFTDPRRAALAFIAALTAACGNVQDDPARESPYTLTVAGDADLTLHPGDRRTLEVLLAGESAGPVAKARVHFAFRDGQAAGSSLDAADVVTDPGGVATVRFTAGPRPTQTPIQLVISAPDLGADPVAFNFSIVALRRVLEIVPSPATVIGADGRSATVSAAATNAVALRVREVDADTSEPIAGDAITFTLPPAASARWSAGVGRTATAVTGLGGRAQVFLMTTAAAEGPWQVVAQPAAGGPSVYFNVTVLPGEPDVGGGCDDPASPCPRGFECVAGACEPPGGSGCDADAPACGSGQCCDAASRICKDECASSCAPGTHCQPAPVCGQGSCVADGNETVPDVSGLWSTRHDFRIRDALPLPVRELFTAFRVMDQTILGKLTFPGLPGWLQEIINAFVARLLQQYLPGWFQVLIHLADDFGTVLGNLRAQGVMRLSRNPDPAHLRGAEVWTNLVFYWLPLCEGEISGNPFEPPECARIDVVTSDSGLSETAQCKGEALPSIRVQVSPFTAAVAKRGGSPFLDVGRRQVNLEMRKVMLILVDQLITAVSAGEYPCIQEATDCRPGTGCLVDCDGLGTDVESATGGVVDSGTVQQLCGAAVRITGEAVSVALASAWPVDADALDFSGSASISGIADDGSCEDGAIEGSCAAQLGNARWDQDLNNLSGAVRENRDGRWTGNFFYQHVGPLPGAWQATREE